MDIGQIGVAVSLLSVSMAVIKTSWDGKKKNNNNDCVKKPDCHNTMKIQNGNFNQRFDDLKDHLDIRFEDMKDFIKNGK